MKGKWVYSVIIGFGSTRGVNSVYENLSMARIKKIQMQREIDRTHGKQTVRLQKIMYFKDKVKEGSFEDCCSVCGDQLNNDKPLTKI